MSLESTEFQSTEFSIKDFPTASEMQKLSEANYGKIDETDTRCMQLLSIFSEEIKESARLGVFEVKNKRNVVWENDYNISSHRYISTMIEVLTNFLESKGYRIVHFYETIERLSHIHVNDVEPQRSYWKCSIIINYCFSWKT
jgi:hypothetical protein